MGGCWRGVPGPIRTRGAPGARALGSSSPGAAPPGELWTGGRSLAGVSGRTGLSGLSSWVSAVRDRLASVIFFLRPARNEVQAARRRAPRSAAPRFPATVRASRAPVPTLEPPH